MQIHIHLWSFVGHVKDKEIHFLQKGWVRLLDMTESEGEK